MKSKHPISMSIAGGLHSADMSKPSAAPPSLLPLPIAPREGPWWAGSPRGLGKGGTSLPHTWMASECFLGALGDSEPPV